MHVFIALLALLLAAQPVGTAMARDASPSEGPNAANDPLVLSLTLEYSETSKDSNRQRYSAEIDGETMRLAKEFYGFEAPENEYSEKVLDAAMTDAIRAYIEEHGLDCSLREEKPMDGLGLAGLLHLEIRSGAPSTLHISGRVRMWDIDAPSPEAAANLDNANYFSTAESFFRFLWLLSPAP